ncbi:MAG TPA: right-handed parallel beta-helix repeat-containing protein [Phycisphaerales bacterium]|nr:right-handed parallel beta-helix repeat-containing protein [Phycisphaerales bacterium]
MTVALLARSAAAVAVATWGAASALGQTVWHVDAGGASPGNGSSWSAAFADLHSALAVCAPGDEVRVAAGRYAPAPAGGDRSITFTLPGGVRLLGGFAGSSGPDPEQNDPGTYVTLLTGDLNSDDGAGFTNIGDNSFNVVTVTGPDTVIDGVTIAGGNADLLSPFRAGAGAYYFGGDHALSRCTLRGNVADAQFGTGGAIFAYGGTISLTDCLFTSNSSRYPNTPFGNGGWGGAIFAQNLVATACDFIGNRANEGGGVYFDGAATLTACTFSSNTARRGGGLFRSGFIPAPTPITSCEFRGNSAFEGGGIMFDSGADGPAISSCLFVGNTASGFGGGIAGLAGTMTLTRSVFTGNSASAGGGALTCFGDSPAITNCTIAGNTAGQGGGINITASNGTPEVRNCILWDNTDAGGMGELAQIDRFFSFGTFATVNYSCVQGWTGALACAGCAGNIAADPMFASAPQQDFALLAGSPCINAGDPSPAFNDPDGSRNDMGALPASFNTQPEAVLSCQQLTGIGSAALVRLDGSGSADAESARAALTFTWWVDGAPVCDGSAGSCEVIDVHMSYGEHTVALRVTDEGGLLDEESMLITVTPAALSVLRARSATVNFDTGALRVQGEVALPSGVNYTEIARTARVGVRLAGIEAVPSAGLALPGGSASQWSFATGAALGVTRLDIDWTGTSFKYNDRHFPVSMRADTVTSTQTVLTLKFNSRRMGGAFTVAIGGQATATVDAAGNVQSTVPFTVSDAGRDVTLVLPFAIQASTAFVFTGSASGTIVAGPYLANSVGRFNLEAAFDTAAFPDSGSTTPRTLEVDASLGTEGYAGTAQLGPLELLVRRDRWRSE